MAAETTPQERAQQIISSYVDNYVKNDLQKAPNRLRGINLCMLGLYKELKNNKLGRELCPLQATIGDIDPWEISLNFKGERDVFEQGRFSDLTERLGLDPEPVGGVYDRIDAAKKEIQTNYKRRRLEKDQVAWVPSRYYPEGGRGTAESRGLLMKEAEEIGLKAEIKDIWMGYGGMNVIQRTVRAVNTYFEKKIPAIDRRKSLLLSPTIGFNMATNSISQSGPEVEYVPTSDLPNNELTAERLEQYFDIGEQNEHFGERGKIPDMMLLTPANNPTAQSNDPEKLRGVLKTMIEYNKDVIFIFDMAYMWTIPREKAMNLMNVIKETGADQRTVFVISESKRMGRPGSRIAGAVVLDKKLKNMLDLNKIFVNDTMGNEPSWSGELDVYYQALSQVIDETAYDDLTDLLRQRQRAFLDVLKDLDPNHELFDEEINRVYIPGSTGQKPENAIEQDVPLYLWLKLKEGVTAFDVLKKLHIGGAPSEVFGPENGDVDRNHLRLSMGFVSTYDILSKSKAVMSKWEHIKPTGSDTV